MGTQVDTEPATSPTTSAPAAPIPKEFRCVWGNCTKSFSRAEHLHRHALNHDESRANLTCERCSAVFKRKDLIDRHMARHREKDEEAGGEGLGRLQTRKRLWRDQTGTVVAKRRPELEKRKRTTSGTSRSRNIATSQDDGVPTAHAQEHAPISPPGSSQDHQSNGPDAMETSEKPGYHQQDALWPVSMGDVSMINQAGAIAEPYDFLCNASWGSQPQGSANSDLIFGDLFAPDTASSFNNPFTTMNYYNWLLGTENWPANNSFDPTNGLEMTKLSMGITHSMPHAPRSTPSLSVSDSSGEYGSTGQYYDVPNHGFRVPGSDTNPPSGIYSRDVPTPETSAANQILAMSQMAEPNFAATLGYQDGTVHRSQPQAVDSPNFMPTPTNSNSNAEISRSNRTRRLPIMTEEARQGVLDFVHRARPKTPDDVEILVDNDLLQLSVLQAFCDLYFKRFNTAYPLLHQATFEPSQVDPLLLISALLLGATYSDKDSHLFAICLHNVMRAQIFGSLAFNTRPKLWMLQTILLIECFGKSRAGQLQHDMSHLFHGLLINLIRRSDCQSARCAPFDDNDGHDMDRRWKAEVEAEQKRRLALLCFMWDTQHAVLFSQSLCMNAAELKLTLPWNEPLWEAESPEEWYSINLAEKPQPQYLAVLKTYFTPDREGRTLPLNALSRVLMLHGIMSVAWDLNRRDQTSLGLITTPTSTTWQSLLTHSYETWKLDFDTFTKSHLDSLSSSPSSTSHVQKANFIKFTTSTLAIYHSARIILQMDINDLQIYAGAPHIIGRPVTSVDYSRSKARVENWCKKDGTEKSAAKAAWHAARVLRDGIRKLEDWDAGDWFSYPWCLYLASLTVVVFQLCSKPSPTSTTSVEAILNPSLAHEHPRTHHTPHKHAHGEGDAGTTTSDTEEDSDWDARAEMSALVSAITRSSLEDLTRVAGRYRTGDLPGVVGRYLSTVRWAVVQEGMKVLVGLSGSGRDGRGR